MMNTMQRILLSSLFLLILSSASAQSKSATEEVLRKVADNIVQSTSFSFVNSKTGEKFTSLQGKDTSSAIRAENKFNKWQYVNGVLTVGMLRLADVLHDNKYADYS